MSITAFLANFTGPLREDNEPFQGVYGASGRIRSRIPVGPTYHRMYLLATDGGVALTPAEWLTSVDRIRFVVDGDIKIELTAREAIYRQRLYEESMRGTPGGIVNGILCIDFASEWFAAVQNREASAYGMAASNSFQIEVDFLAANICDSMRLFHERTVGVPLDRHFTLRRNTYDIAGAGVREIIDLPRSPSAVLGALHIARLDGAAHDITQVELLIDGSRIINLPTNVLLQSDAHLGHQNGNDASILTIDFLRRNRWTDGAPQTYQDMRLRLTAAAGGYQIGIITERAEVQTVQGVN